MENDQEGELNPHTYAMQPKILEENELVRICCIISLLDHDSIPVQPQ